MDLQERIELKLNLIEDSESFRSTIIKKVIDQIKGGESALKKAIASNNVSMADVVRSIKTQRCLRAPDRDFGHTYLEQIVGIAIRDVIPVQHINAAREIFGLEKLPPSELVKQKKSSLRKQQTPKPQSQA